MLVPILQQDLARGPELELELELEQVHQQVLELAPNPKLEPRLLPKSTATRIPFLDSKADPKTRLS
jgi:hypothetical protein